ncbi:GGDEF domain-containing protein [Salipaludibacillus agaradhaerens]|uniref:GGDEF domain-containing protein n=1 Tax=Salipaludibacillus agaradhaerens TaxID=76935 RepID=A0A9Q4AZK9_SALAG|nr:EAL domain-containing protein [Salipaludibacillus agaradhaerens]MCR6095698.1 GGDEF domain-containing protein [Salipaludibacillus agaradhaerens]MCR6114742.1 GGDEF domain-containing protein [Salipaludibacillus agaradhaerens]
MSKQLNKKKVPSISQKWLALFNKEEENQWIEKDEDILPYCLKQAIEEVALIVLTDFSGRIVYMSDELLTKLDYLWRDVNGHHYINLIDTVSMKENVRKSLHDVLHDGKKRTIETVHRKKDGTSVIFDTTFLPLPQSKPSHDQLFLILHQDTTLLNKAEEMINDLVTLDLATGLRNRKQFDQDLANYVRKTENSRKQIAILFLDLDRFKFYNDTLGHVTGDKLIEAISKELKLFENNDVSVYRYDGDEFTVLINESNIGDSGMELAKAILNRFLKPFVVKGNELFITASIGIARCPETGTTASQLVQQAEAAMHYAKERGKGDYQLYFPSLKTHHTEKLLIETRLREALGGNSFTLSYQPQIDLKSKQVVGVEALIRWEDNVLGKISPVEFIPVAEETGLIVQIGDWVLQEACHQAKIWYDQGFHLRIGVNISPIQFQRPDFVEKVNGILQKTGLPPKYLDLEITENDLLYNRDECYKTLKRLKESGIKISIDDFGTGYSSLSYLRRFPIDTLKIDKSFIKEVIQNINDQAIVTSIIQLAHNMNMRVIAEGVETSDMVAFLNDRECDEMQGFLYSMPLKKEDVIPFINKTEPQKVL